MKRGMEDGNGKTSRGGVGLTIREVEEENLDGGETDFGTGVEKVA